jgi:hypothetical protein
VSRGGGKKFPEAYRLFGSPLRGPFDPSRIHADTNPPHLRQRIDNTKVIQFAHGHFTVETVAYEQIVPLEGNAHAANIPVLQKWNRNWSLGGGNRSRASL